MGRAAGATAGGRRAARAATLGKKALSIRPRQPHGADARPRPGSLIGGRSGASRSGRLGAVDWPASLLKGRPRSVRELLRRPRSAQADELWLVIVDASASTRRQGALSQAKGLLASVFDQAYRQRVRLAVLAASGQDATWRWQGQKASAALNDWLQDLGAGGGTPLIEALQQASDWLLRRQRLKPAENQRLLVLTDGRLHDWPALLPAACPALLVDIECAPIRLGRAQRLAAELGAEYRHIEEMALQSR